jgi:glycerol-3-phosphate dehydrogenase
LFDHETRDGVGGFVSIVGGKLTTYRLMAAEVCDRVAKKLGIESECATAKTPFAGRRRSQESPARNSFAAAAGCGKDGTPARALKRLE